MDNEIDYFKNYAESEKNFSENTLKAYLKDLQQLAVFLESENNGDDLPASEVTRNHLSYYCGHCFDLGLEKSSLQRKIAAIKTFFAFLYRRGEISSNPAASLIFPRRKKNLPVFLSDSQVRRMIEIETDGFISLRDRALMETFYSTGARVSELAAALVSDVDLPRKTMKVFGKGSVERIVFLTDDAARYISEYIEKRKAKFGADSDNLFVNARGGKITVRGIFYIISKRSRSADFSSSVTPHTLRHSFATEMLNGGADIRAVQELLGHRSISATQVYTHTSRRRQAEVYRRCHPHGSNLSSDDES